MATSSISSELVSEVGKTIGSVANSVIFRWLESKSLPHSHKTSKELVLTVCKLIEEKRVDFDEFKSTIREVEECSGKVIYLRKIPDLKLLKNDDEISKHLRSRLPTPRSKEFETIKEPDSPMLNYLKITDDEIRLKFSESHFKLTLDVETESVEKKTFTVTIVVSIDRKTGFTLIYFDSPGQKHPYPTDSGKYSEKAYFNHYLDQLRIIFPTIQVADFGQEYNNLLKLRESRVLKATTNSDLTTDNVKRILHGTDLMTAPTFANLILDNKSVIIHDYATVNFLKSAADGKLLEDVFVRVYPGEGKISIPAVRLPFEVDYVISRIKSV